jgi:aspartate/methionine/tyrosine aminotransferase
VQGETNAESLTDPCSVLILSTATTLNADDPWIRLAQAQNAYVIWVDASPSGAMTTAAPAFHPAQVEALRPHVVTIGGLDGDFAGWRIGWMCGSDVAEKLRSFKQSMTICSTAVSQWAAIEVLKGMKHG